MVRDGRGYALASEWKCGQGHQLAKLLALLVLEYWGTPAQGDRLAGPARPGTAKCYSRAPYEPRTIVKRSCNPGPSDFTSQSPARPCTGLTRSADTDGPGFAVGHGLQL